MEILLNLSEVKKLNRNFEDGRKLSKESFFISEQLGSGSFGKVYKVSSKKTQRFYALKILSKKQISGLKLWKQLCNEVRILIFCNHPNIIKLHSVFEEGNKIMMVMEFANGNSLFNRLRKQRFFSEEETAQMMIEVISALDYLHSMTPPILHRDLKPENILFNDGQLKIADFGWSNLDDSFRNTFCGTPDYLSPEMIKGTGHDEKLDIWTLGILMYELLHGRPPFSPATKIKDKRKFQSIVEENVLKGEILFKKDLTIQAIKVIQIMLDPDAVKRPSAKELLALEFFVNYL